MNGDRIPTGDRTIPTERHRSSNRTGTNMGPMVVSLYLQCFHIMNARPFPSLFFGPRLIAILATWAVASSSIAQQATGTISGYITDERSGEALIGATVYDLRSGKGTVSNVYGFYSLTLPSDSVALRFTFVGYQPAQLRTLLTGSLTHHVELGPSLELREVEVVGRRTGDEVESTRMGTIELPMEKVRSLPVLLGERDVIKTLQLLPGVQSGSEGSSGLYVRGGGPDQNLILLDGVPVYNANHLFGFFSVFNTDAIRSATLTKGGFPAEYGGRLSSVIDLRMKEGNNQKLHGEGGIGLIASRITLEGPLRKESTSFMISARRTYLDVLARPLIRSSTDGNSTGGYYFYDLNTKVNHRFSDRSRLYLSGYFGRDRFYARDRYTWNNAGDTYEDKNETGLDWGNAIGALRWNYVFNPRLFSNTTLTYSNYRFRVINEQESIRTVNGTTTEEFWGITYRSGIEDWSMRTDFNYMPVPEHYIKFGGGAILHTFTPGVSRAVQEGDQASQDTTFGSAPTKAQEFFMYAQDEIALGGKVKVNAGLHGSGFLVNGTTYLSLQPRVSGRYLLNERSSVKLSYANMAQFLHLLTNAGIGLPTDLWVPPTDRVKPQFADQVAAGYTRSFSDTYMGTFEAYYKYMRNLIEYKDGATFLATGTDWQNNVAVGNGWSYGGEWLLEKKEGKTTGWIGYTLSWTQREFEELNEGRVFPYRYDRRHDVSVALTHHFNERVDVGLVWVYGTGSAVTLPLERYQTLGQQNDFFGTTEVDHIEERNNYRTPAYHRLDLGVNMHKKTRWGERTWSLGLYNAYSRQNPFYLYFSVDDAGRPRLTQISLFPIVPSATYNFTF